MKTPCQRKCRSTAPTTLTTSMKFCGNAMSFSRLDLAQQRTDFLEFFARRGRMPTERMQNQLRGRSVEQPLHHVREIALLRAMLGDGRFVYMCALRIVALDQTFGMHDLQHLQRGGVARAFICVQRFVHL